ncbi:MAG: hypothetical protein K0S43_387 [Cellulosimicrobium sp.]|nr:hypothetical protein [Cellulosimicrobium sp.]
MSETIDQTMPESRALAGLDELLPPGAAQQVRAEHDAVVGTLQALLAEARQDADRATEAAAAEGQRADALAAELEAERANHLAAYQRAAANGAASLAQRPVTDAVREIVDAASAVIEAGRGAPGAMDRRKRLERSLAAAGGPLAVVISSARWTDRYGRVGAVDALDALLVAVRALPAEEAHRG